MNMPRPESNRIQLNFRSLIPNRVGLDDMKYDLMRYSQILPGSELQVVNRRPKVDSRIGFGVEASYFQHAKRQRQP
jgi:hypothetical protein